MKYEEPNIQVMYVDTDDLVRTSSGVKEGDPLTDFNNNNSSFPVPQS